eukprot:5043634-Pyramimonas_sp.AAC.1
MGGGAELPPQAGTGRRLEQGHAQTTCAQRAGGIRGPAMAASGPSSIITTPVRPDLEVGAPRKAASYTMLCYAMPCYAMLRYAMIYEAKLSYAIS